MNGLALVGIVITVVSDVEQARLSHNSHHHHHNRYHHHYYRDNLNQYQNHRYQNYYLTFIILFLI